MRKQVRYHPMRDGGGTCAADVNQVLCQRRVTLSAHNNVNLAQGPMDEIRQFACKKCSTRIRMSHQ